MESKRYRFSKIKLGTGFAAFIIFFGVSVLEAVQRGSARWIIFWLAIGIVFLVADNMKK